jgi:hypothetical protein
MLALYASMGSAQEHKGRPQSLPQVQKPLLEQGPQKQKIHQACIIGGLVSPAPNLSARRFVTTKGWGDGGESNPHSGSRGRFQVCCSRHMSKPSPQWGRVNRAPVRRLLFTRSYNKSGRGGEIRTPNLRIQSPLLYLGGGLWSYAPILGSDGGSASQTSFCRPTKITDAVVLASLLLVLVEEFAHTCSVAYQNLD